MTALGRKQSLVAAELNDPWFTAAQLEALPRIYGDIDTATDKACSAFENGNPRRPLIAPGLDIVDPGPQEPSATDWQIDFRGVSLLQGSEVQIDATLRQCNLRNLISQLGKKLSCVSYAISIEPEPTRASAREFRSVVSQTPAVIGVLIVATDQSVSPGP